MTHSPALTLARYSLALGRPYVNSAAREGYDGTQGADIRKEAAKRTALIDEAIAAIDAELAASADAGRLPYTTEHHIALREAHCTSAGEAFWKVRTSVRDSDREAAFDAGFLRGFDIATKLADERAALSRPAPATAKDSLTVAPVSAQGDEQSDFEAWVHSPECPIPAGTSVVDPIVLAAYAGWQARAQVAQGDEVDAARYRWLKSKATTEGRDGGWIGLWRLPLIPAWDDTPYSANRGEALNFRDDLDAAVDAARAQQGGQR